MKPLISLLLFLFLAGCSTRVEYTTSTVISSSAEAVNINTATVTELEQLPYIGRSTAEAIVEFRQKNGPFRRAEQLMLIRGVSETRFLEIRHLVRVM